MVHSVFVVLTSFGYGDCIRVSSIHPSKEGAEAEKERLVKKGEEDGGSGSIFWTEEVSA